MSVRENRLCVLQQGEISCLLCFANGAIYSLVTLLFVACEDDNGYLSHWTVGPDSRVACCL